LRAAGIATGAGIGWHSAGIATGAGIGWHSAGIATGAGIGWHVQALPRMQALPRVQALRYCMTHVSGLAVHRQEGSIRDSWWVTFFTPKAYLIALEVIVLKSRVESDRPLGLEWDSIADWEQPRPVSPNAFLSCHLRGIP
jgi:hypothetical protein